MNNQTDETLVQRQKALSEDRTRKILEDHDRISIKNFIDFLEIDMAEHQARNSSKRMDIHRWMIKYLQEKTDKCQAG